MDRERRSNVGPRWRLGVLLVPFVLVAFTAVGLTRVELDTSTASFLPSRDPLEKALAEKADDFGGDPVVVLIETRQKNSLVSQPDVLLRMVQLEGKLAVVRDVAAVYGPGTVLNQTAGAAQDMLAQISGRRDGYRHEVMAKAREEGLSKAQAQQLGEAATRRFDERYGAVVVQAMPAGLPTLRNPRFVASVLLDPGTNEARPQWRYLMPTSRSLTILVRPRAGLDADATAQLVAGVRRTVAQADLPVTRTTVTGAPAIAAGLAEAGRYELPVLGAAALASVGLIFLVGNWTRSRRSRLRPTIAALIGTAVTLACFGWADAPLSLGVVAFLPILLGIGSDFPLYFSRGGSDRAVVVTALAAIVGFGSLTLSPLPFVRELGLALALGITMTLAAAWMLRRYFGPVPPPNRVVKPAAPLQMRPAVRVAVAGAVLLSALGGWAALAQLDVEGRPDQLAAGLAELKSAKYVERTLGSAGEVSLVISAKNVTDPAVLRWTKGAQQRIVSAAGDRAHPVLSIVDLLGFLGSKPTASQVAAAYDVMPRYLTSAVTRSDQATGLVILAVEFDDVAELEQLLDDVVGGVGDPPKGVRAELVGLPVSAARGLELVQSARLWINLAGIGLAGLVLFIGLGRAVAGRAVLAVLVATGWLALAAAATVGSLSPLTVALGSLVTATGCEFSVMLRQGSRWRAVATAAAAGVAGYLVLGLSELAVLRDFGLLLAGGVALSFLAALVIDALASTTDPSWTDRPELQSVESAGEDQV